MWVSDFVPLRLAKLSLRGKCLGSLEADKYTPQLSGGSPSAIQAQGTNSPTKLSVPSRRQRNQSSRQHDLEFAAELGQGLLVEVRRLQALLSEREEAFKIVQIEKVRLEQLAEGLEFRIRALDESEQKFKEENWDLELQNQELLGRIREHEEDNDKLQALIQHEANDKELLLKDLDEWKDRNEKLYEDLEAEHKHHESEFAAMRRSLANNETDRHIMEKRLEDLRAELEESHNQSARLRSALEHKSDDRDGAGLFDMQPAQTTPEHSPPSSPTKPTPRHTHLESETLKSSLQHAHRMIANLKSNIHREKTEKAELRRLLQDARDDLETARLRRDSVGGPPSSADRRRKGKGTFSKGSRPPIFKATLLGGPRQSRDEITLVDNHLVDEDWEEAPDEPSPTRRSFPVLTEYTLRPPGMGTENTVFESAFETANETVGDSTTDIFETAYEQSTTTETEAYKTGNESPVNDYPTSADDGTETEGGALLKVIQKKSSIASSFGRQVRPLRLGGIRRDSLASTASTDDDDYTVYDEDDDDVVAGDSAFTTPTATSNQRLKLRVNRGRGRGARMPSQFSTRDRTFSVDSSPGGGNGNRSGSPASLNQRLHKPGERKSLFAELEDGMFGGEGEDDEGETETETEEDDVPTTPTRNFTPFMPVKADTGVHPELERSSFLGITDLERPRTAHSAVSAATIEERLSTTDVGTQSERELASVVIGTANAETQSDEMSARSVPKTIEIGTQFDPELENVLVPMVGMEDAHGSREGSKGKGFFAIPLPIPVPIPTRVFAPDLSNDLRLAEESRKLAEEAARQAEVDRQFSAEVALSAEESRRIAEAAAAKSALDFISAQQELTALKPKIVALETEILGLKDERTVLQEKAGAQVELDTLKPKIGALEREIEALTVERAGLQEKVEAREGEVTVLQPQVVALEKEIESLKEERTILAKKAVAHEELIVVKPRIMVLEKEVENLTTQHASLQEKAVAQEEEVVTVLKPKIALLEKEIEALTSERASLQEKAGSQEKEVVTVLQPKIAILEKEVEALALERASLHEKAGAQEKEVVTILQPKIAALEKDIETLTSERASLQEKAGVQENEVNIVLIPKIAILEKEIEALTLERATLQQKTVAQEKEVVDVLKPMIVVLQKNIETLSTEHASLQDKAEAQEKKEVTVLQPKIRALEDNIESLTTERASLQEKTAAHEKEVNIVLVPRIAILQTEIHALNTERTSLQEKVGAQENKEFTVLQPMIAALEKEVEALSTERTSLQEKAGAQERKELTVLQPKIVALEKEIVDLKDERAVLQVLAGAHEEVDVLKPRIAVLEKEVESLKVERDDLHEKAGAHEEEVIVLKPKLVLLEKDIQGLKDERAILQEQVAMHEEEAVVVLRPKIAALESEVQILMVERTGLQGRVVAYEEEVAIVLGPKITALEEEVSSLKIERAGLQEKAGAHEEEITVLTPKIIALETEVESLKVERDDLQEEASGYKNQLLVLEPRIVTLETEIGTLNAKHVILQEEAGAHAEEVLVLKPKVIALEKEIESLLVNHASLQEEAGAYEKEVSVLKPKIVGLERQIECLKDENVVLVEKVVAHEELIVLKDKELESLTIERANLQEKAGAYENKIITLKPRIVALEEEILRLKDERAILVDALAAVPPKQETKDTGIQFDPEPEIVEEQYTLVMDKVAEVEPSIPKPEAPLEYSSIKALSITPIEPEPTRTLLAPVPIIVSPPAMDASVSSDDETPKKVSETIEDAQHRPTTPSPEKPSRFFGSMFGRKRPGSPIREPEGLSGASERTFSNSTFGAIERNQRKTTVERDEVVKATEPVPVSDQSAQTDITSEFFDNLPTAKTVDKGKRPAFAVVAPEAMFTGDMSSTKTSSLRSRTSHDSFGLNKTRGGAIRRPESAASLREHRVVHPSLPSVASVPSETGSMGPPLAPSNSTLAQRNSVSFGLKAPSTDTIKPISPEGSKAGTTPRPKFSNSRSEVSSPTSRRSSISSFASEIDSRFNIAPEAVASEVQTDPRMIQAITQTMIGEYLWKYTRGAGRGTLSASRHKRFFWVHPYTRTLYWSDRDPTTAGRAELRAKSVAIEAVRVVTDDNPMPPGLHRKSLVIVTPGRSLKFTAPTGQRHETWFNVWSLSPT